MKNDDTNNSFCNPAEVDAVADSCCGERATKNKWPTVALLLKLMYLKKKA